MENENKLQAAEAVRQRLFALQDTAYGDFQAKLIPTMDRGKLIGVRTPKLRELAKELAGTEEAAEFMRQLPHRYYEEDNLHGMLISLMKDFAACVEELDRFLPFVDNWATCDLMSPKLFKKHRQELLPVIRRWIASGKTYTVRFGIGMLMGFYLEDDVFDAEFLELAAELRTEEYYVNMMTAWYFATALAKQYEKTLPFLQEQRLDRWTHNKAIQKAIESRRITAGQKEYLRSLKR